MNSKYLVWRELQTCKWDQVQESVPQRLLEKQ
jgi:hypothetical protein